MAIPQAFPGWWTVPRAASDRPVLGRAVLLRAPRSGMPVLQWRSWGL